MKNRQDVKETDPMVIVGQPSFPVPPLLTMFADCFADAQFANNVLSILLIPSTNIPSSLVDRHTTSSVASNQPKVIELTR